MLLRSRLSISQTQYIEITGRRQFCVLVKLTSRLPCTNIQRAPVTQIGCTNRLSAVRPRGRTIVNVVPTPSSLLQLICPPWASTSFLQRYSPKPVPLLLFLPDSACENLL